METVGIVPAYNEAGTIGSVIDQVSEHVDEVVVVDDGSTDDTAPIAREHGATVIAHVVNMGVGGAVRTGYLYAIRHEFDFAVQVDADGQHDPTHLPNMLDVAKECDMVIGSRYLNESIQEYSKLRRAGIRFFTQLVKFLGDVEITDVTSGYRIYRVERLEEILHRSNKHWAVEQTLEAGDKDLRIEEVSVKMPVRSQGESQFTMDTFALYPVRMADTILRILLFR